MTISNAQFAAWLKRNPASYTVLFEVDYMAEVDGAPVLQTLRVSTQAYTDTANGHQYVDWIDTVPTYSRQLIGDKFSNYASTIGALVLSNPDGRCDEFADAYNTGHDARCYVGDLSWQFDDFHLIFIATGGRISVPSLQKLSIELRDTGILLNKNIGGDIRIGGSGPNADRFRPVNIGYVAQTEAILYDVGTQTYVHSDTGLGLWLGSTPQTVRDNGYPVGATDNADGTLTLDATAVGTITTNVMATPAGDESARLTSDVINELVGERAGLIALGKYAGAQDTFTVGGDEDWPLGLNIIDRRLILDVLLDICDSGQCFWAVDRFNQFFFGRLRPSYIDILGVGPSAVIDQDRVMHGSMSRDTIDSLYYKYQITVSRNWTIPSTTVAVDDIGDPLVLSTDELAIVTRRGLSVAQDDSADPTYLASPELYHVTLSLSPVIDTLLSDPDDEVAAIVGEAWMEVERASQLPWLHVVSLRTRLDFYELELGKVVQISYPRFGYDNGVAAQIVGIDIDVGQSKRQVGLKLLRRHVQEPYAGRVTVPEVEPDPDTQLPLGRAERPPFVGPPVVIGPTPPVTGGITRTPDGGFTFGIVILGGTAPTCTESITLTNGTFGDSFGPEVAYNESLDDIWYTSTAGGLIQLDRGTLTATQATSEASVYSELIRDSVNDLFWARSASRLSKYASNGTQTVTNSGADVFSIASSPIDGKLYGWHTTLGGAEGDPETVGLYEIDRTTLAITGGAIWSYTTAGGTVGVDPDSFASATGSIFDDAGLLWIIWVDNPSGPFEVAIRAIDVGTGGMAEYVVGSDPYDGNLMSRGVGGTVWIGDPTGNGYVLEIETGGNVRHSMSGGGSGTLKGLLYSGGHVFLNYGTSIQVFASSDMTTLITESSAIPDAADGAQRDMVRVSGNRIFYSADGLTYSLDRAGIYKFCL